MQKINIKDKNYPQKFIKIKNPPQDIYVEGDISLLNNPILAIVGARKSTQYGEKYAKIFASQIGMNGITVVSGLATGIDTIAHVYSKNTRGKTIAVIGSGLNKIYPQKNKKLAEEIIKEGGCLLSENDPNQDIDMKNFPKRNNLICALADGIFVIEADYRSGSRLTGNIGLKYGKKVFCLPRNLGESRGLGTNLLIQKGAKLVISPEDILKEYGIKYKKQKEIKNTYRKKSEIEVKEEYRKLYEKITYKPININEIAKKTKLTISEINQSLTMMEIEGYIQSLPGNEYKRIE